MALMSETALAAGRADEELEEILGSLAGLLSDLLGSVDDVALASSGRFWSLLHSLRQRHGAGLSVALLALAKSGKSTLVNALLGDELMPVSNVPETARICRVTHTPSALPTLAPLDAGGAPTAGAPAIAAALRALNAEARGHARGAADERLLDITAPFVALSEGGPCGPGARLCLLDTPGPNEAGEEGLRFQVERLLCGVDAAVYLLDYTKLKTQEEADMLGRLRTLNPELVRRLCTRLFVAVNKFDQADTGPGLGAEETREYVAQEVTRQIALPGFILHPDQVLVISARDALLSRLALSGRASPDAAARFARAAFGPAGARALERRPAAEREEAVRGAAVDMLETSGVPELEERVLGFLYANSAGLKLMATIDDAGRLLAEVGNAASACAASLATDAAGLASSRDALAAEIGETLFGFDGVLAAAEELEVEVVDELRSHLANLRIRLFQHISDAFDERRARRGDAGAGRWAAVRRTFAAVFGGGAGSRDEVGSALLELHDAVTTQIEAEVSEAWHVMESACNARARRLAAALNDALERLSARVEGAVEAQLDVRLEPVALRMEAPTRDAFHADLQALIENGISEVPERHVRVAERTQLEWELRRRGVCRMSRYWVQVPRTRRVVETYTAVSYNLCPQVVRDQFMQAVDTAILTTERSLPPYVREFVRRQVEAARTQAREYGDSYLASMRSALEASSAGADVRAEAHARVSGHCDAAATLRARLAGLAARVEALVPHNAGAAGLFEQVEWPSSEEEEGNEEEARREAPEALVVAAEAEAEAEAEACAESEAGADAGADAEAAGVAVAEAVAEAEAAAEGLEQVQAGDAALEAAAAAEEQDEVAAYAAAGSPPRRSASGAGSDMFSSCEELGSDELLEAQEAELAASGLLAMRPLPAAAADEAPAAAEAEEERAAAAEDAAAAAEDEAALAAAGDEEAAAAVPAAEEAAPAAEEPLAVEVAAAPEAAAAEGERAAKEEGGDEELPDAAPHHDQGAPAEADVEAAPAAAPEAPAAAGDEPEEALEAAGSEAGGSGSGGALSSYDEVASPATFRSTLSGASSGGGNELLADSLLGFGGADALLARAGASEAAIDEEEAPARSDDGGAAAPALPLPLSSSAHGSAAPAPPAAAAAPDALVCSAASIVPHAEDGGPESPALDFTRSFAEALSAAGLPPAPRPGSSSDPDDWTLVEGLAAELEAGDGADTGRAASAPRR